MSGGSKCSPHSFSAFSSADNTSSSPRKSARANGPGIMPVPIIIPRSMSRTPAMPSSRTRQDSTNALSWKRSASASSTAGAASGVLIEALSALLAEVALVDELLHALVDVEAVAVGIPHVARDLQRGVQARHVGEEERPHRYELGLGEGLVDVLDAGPRLVL